MALRRVSRPAPVPLVRPAQATDAEDLARLFAHLGFSATAEEVRARLWSSAPWRVALVAELGIAVAGAAVIEVHHPLHRRGREAQVTALVTDADARHRGLGRALVSSAVAWARREGCDSVFVRVHARRDDAHAFFGAIGFEQTHLCFDWPLPGA